MKVSFTIDTWLVVFFVSVFIALRVWHPITRLAGRRKTAKTTIR